MRITAKVLKVLQTEKISPDELMTMLREAAFTSLRGSNLRYFQWLFTRKGNMLLDMQRADLMEIGRGQNRMLEEHDACDGEGCRTCGWAGVVSRAMQDPTASSDECHVLTNGHGGVRCRGEFSQGVRCQLSRTD